MLTHLLNKCLIESVLTKPVTPVLTQIQIVRHKSKIPWCGYKEYAPHKVRDIRYKTATWHRPKLMTWQDYQFRKYKAEDRNKKYPVWQARMDYAENLVRLGMPDWTISKTLDLHPHCVQYLRRKLSGNVEVLREAEYSNYVNHRTGDY